MQYLEWQLRDIANMIEGLNRVLPAPDAGIDMAYPEGFHWGDGFRAVVEPDLKIAVHTDAKVWATDEKPLGWLVRNDFQWEFLPYTEEIAND